MATSPNRDLLQRSSINKWLTGHHPDVALSYARPIRKQQIEDWMKSSFIPSETREATLWNRDPDEIIVESLVFTQESKPATTSDELKKVLHKPESFDHALDVAHKVGGKRIAHGINPATILAEHRRQVILKALLDTGRAKESREECKDRLQAYIDRKGTFATKVVDTSKLSSKSRMRTLSPISPKGPTSPHKSKRESPLRSHRPGSPLSTSSVISTGSFQPEWGNYDVMRHRWAYLRPQTRELVAEDDSIVPTTQSEVFVINGELVCGPLRDVEHFANTASSTKSQGSSKRSLHGNNNGGSSSSGKSWSSKVKSS